MKDDKVRKAFSFFKKAEEQNLGFTLQDICDATGYSIATARCYLSKKWRYFLMRSDDMYKCKGFCKQTTIDGFIALHRQHTELSPEMLRPQYSAEVNTLIDKAREASWLAIQIYNNPLAKFRSCGFIVNMIIAYTALFQAVFERDGLITQPIFCKFESEISMFL